MTLFAHNPRFEWVFFDFDDTLWDHEAAASHAIHQISDAMGVEPVEFARAYLEITQVILGEIDTGIFDVGTSRIVRFERLLERFGIHDRGHDPAALSERYLDTYKFHPSAYEGVGELLTAIKATGAGIGILTNAMHDTQTPKLEGLPGGTHVDWMLTLDQTGCMKPCARFFEMAMERAGRPAPESVVMVGDSWRNDVEPALERGWHAVWVSAEELPLAHPRLARVAHVGELRGVFAPAGCQFPL